MRSRLDLTVVRRYHVPQTTNEHSAPGNSQSSRIMHQRVMPAVLRVVTIAASALVLAGMVHAASPQPPATGEDLVSPTPTVVPTDDLLARMLTPEAEIHLGPGLANQRRLMERASNRSLSYTLKSLWRGIVEYVFPPNALFRRGDALARVYDPELLSDLERAERLMATSDVSPLTIAATPPPRAEPENAEAGPPARPTPPRRQPDTGASRQQVPARDLPPVTIDFDFEANQREQSQLREEAELAGQVVSAATIDVQRASEELTSARREFGHRAELFDRGALAEAALQPARDRVRAAEADLARAEAALAEAQRGYERIAGRIEALEREAADANQQLQAARQARAQQLAATRTREESSDAAEDPDPPPAELQPVEAEPEPEPSVAAAPRSYPMVREVHELAAPRWEELRADAPGLVSEVLTPQGTLVEEGDDLLRVANVQIARLSAVVATSDAPQFRVGRSVTLTFADYPEARFEGWIASVKPREGGEEVEVSLLVVCDSGPFRDDSYLALRWMTLEAGVGEDKITDEAITPVGEPVSAAAQLRLQRIFPTIGPEDVWIRRVTEPTVASREHFSGRLRLEPMTRLADQTPTDGAAAQRLAALARWRASFIEGMTTTILDDGTAISYPADSPTSDAIRTMLEGRVSHRPNLCAGTMREALGWGLGDAHQWAYRLPRMGYVARDDGIPRPGDILVWPFTYGPGRSQHIGFAVRQGRRLMLLSNLNGRLGTSEILGGYIAFYRPCDEAAARL